MDKVLDMWLYEFISWISREKEGIIEVYRRREVEVLVSNNKRIKLEL